jgi:hypothetical protein
VKNANGAECNLPHYDCSRADRFKRILTIRSLLGNPKSSTNTTAARSEFPSPKASDHDFDSSENAPFLAALAISWGHGRCLQGEYRCFERVCITVIILSLSLKVVLSSPPFFAAFNSGVLTHIGAFHSFSIPRDLRLALLHDMNCAYGAGRVV